MHAIFSCHANLYRSVAAVIETENASRHTAVMESLKPTFALQLTKVTGQNSKTATHRDVKKLLRVVQHTDPDGDMTSGGHDWRPVPRVQRTDSKSLRGSKAQPCSRGHWLWLWLCHGVLHCSLPSLHHIKDTKAGYSIPQEQCRLKVVKTLHLNHPSFRVSLL